MPKVKYNVARHRKHKRILKQAKGYWGARSVLYRTAKEAVAKAAKYSTIHRRLKKRDFRRLWITRISAGCKQLGITYSQFIHGLNKANIEINRKMLAELAARDFESFSEIVKQAQNALSA